VLVRHLYLLLQSLGVEDGVYHIPSANQSSDGTSPPILVLDTEAGQYSTHRKGSTLRVLAAFLDLVLRPAP
jgi:hypothetical protein